MKLKFRAIVFVLIFARFLAPASTGEIITGANQPEKYLSLLEDKTVGLVVNHTSQVGDLHLVDFLLENKIDVEVIFAPEHGFRGDASAGAEIKDGIDPATGIPVISLYGKTKKPTPEHLKSIDILIFDIQDVGCRFYTYISTLQLVVEACAENGLPLLILDRPNPNGDYIAGPVLKPGFESFVGMAPIPVVHGMTVGEMAKMIDGEKWHKAKNSCELEIVGVKNYTHATKYELPVAPSPNLPNYLAVRLYPSLCYFEATSVSVGRGTDFPFQVLGGLQPDLGDFRFTPKSIPNAAINPLNKNLVCHGVDLRNLQEIPQFTMQYFIDFYKKYENEEEFLTREHWFNLLAGTDQLLKLIRAGKSNHEIEQHFQPELLEFSQLRKKYLLYPDFK